MKRDNPLVHVGVWANLSTGKARVVRDGQTPPEGFTFEVKAGGNITTHCEAINAMEAFMEGWIASREAMIEKLLAQ
jgi:hypothetical protein